VVRCLPLMVLAIVVVTDGSGAGYHVLVMVTGGDGRGYHHCCCGWWWWPGLLLLLVRWWWLVLSVMGCGQRSKRVLTVGTAGGGHGWLSSSWMGVVLAAVSWYGEWSSVW